MSTPPVLRVSRLAEGIVVRINSPSGNYRSSRTNRETEMVVEGMVVAHEQVQAANVITPPYRNIAQSVQSHIFLHVLRRNEHQRGVGNEVVGAILQLHDLAVNAGAEKVNGMPLQAMVRVVA